MTHVSKEALCLHATEQRKSQSAEWFWEAIKNRCKFTNYSAFRFFSFLQNTLISKAVHHCQFFGSKLMYNLISEFNCQVSRMRLSM